jgi:UDP-N-acetyl-D-mannosaminuronate dehydrogenase
MMRELITNDRVIGGMTPRCSAVAARLRHAFIATLPAGMEHAELRSIDAVAGADIHILLVDHREFRSRPKPAKITLDMRGIWANQMGAA